jgi:dTMP kinase
VFEGIEGAGKSTQLRRVAERLEGAGVAHLAVREPGGTPVGERIRRVVLDPELDPTPETELLLMLAARAEFVRRVVRPALERGEIVLADRYELSTFAYQGEARALGLDRVRELNRFATGGLRPDATLLLLLDRARARARLDEAKADRMERAGTAFHAAVDRAYRRFAREEPNVIAVPADGDPGEVAERVWAALTERWPDRFV